MRMRYWWAALIGRGLIVSMAVVSLSAQGPLPTPGLDPRIEKLVASISQERVQELLTTLVGFGTRHTLSDTSSTTRGARAASQWILDEMRRSSPRLDVSFDTHQIPKGGREDWPATTRTRLTRDVELRNVIAILPGRSPRRIYVTAHYDSLNASVQLPVTPPATSSQPDPNAEAPGANDDGSGTVLVMELARLFADSGIEFDATLAFMATAGEEQGLVGARVHAGRAKDAGVAVQAVFNNDIVGGTTGGDGIVDGATVRLYSDGPDDSPSRALAGYIRRVAATYVPSHRVRLLARRDRIDRGGDHTAFNLSGFAAVGFRESRENFAKQHGAADTIDGVSFPYLAQNMRVNAAAVASLALAPPPPTFYLLDRGTSRYDARLGWKAAANAVGYRIFWRDAWSPDWQHELLVGNVTQYVLPRMIIDDYVFGVAAIGAGGHESTIAAYQVSPAR
jgi:hypothetical protein